MTGIYTVSNPSKDATLQRSFLAKRCHPYNPVNRPHMAKAISLAVCGLHLRGQPLNHQLTSLGATFCKECWSAPAYRLFAITDALKKVTKPGMIRVAEGGVRVYLEIWSVPIEQFGRFMVQVPPPLGIGTVGLEDGSSTYGFVCEGIVGEGGPGVEDISHLGSWLEYDKADNREAV